MTTFKQYLRITLSICLSASLLMAATLANAEGNSNGNGNANGKGKNIGNGNASNGVKGLLSTGKGIVYTGQSLEISLRFPRGSDLIDSGEVDAFVVIFTPDASAEPVVVPVGAIASPTSAKLFEVAEVDISTLPAGQYQLGLILTIPGGDPLNISEWHDGLLGMIDVKGLTISDEALTEDEDGDGHFDDDADGDGFHDDDEEEEVEETADHDHEVIVEHTDDEVSDHDHEVTVEDTEEEAEEHSDEEIEEEAPEEEA